MINVSQVTKKLVGDLKRILRDAGVKDVTSCERWEKDGVFVVGPKPDGDGCGWYLTCCGNDNEYYDAGVDFINIWSDREKHSSDLNVKVRDLKHLKRFIKQFNE